MIETLRIPLTPIFRCLRHIALFCIRSKVLCSRPDCLCMMGVLARPSLDSLEENHTERAAARWQQLTGAQGP